MAKRVAADDNLRERIEALASSPWVDSKLVAEFAQLLTSGPEVLRKYLPGLVADLERKAATAVLAAAVDAPRGPSRVDILALARRGPTARTELPTLLKILDGDDDELRSLAAEAIGAVAPGSQELLPRLLTVLFQQPRLDVRAMRYARAVAAVGPAAAPELLRRLETGTPIERALAVTALCVLSVESPQPTALPLLLRAAEDTELGDARAFAVAALGALTNSEPAIKKLAELVSSRDVPVSREAALALAKSPQGTALLLRACEKKTRPPALRKLGWVVDDPARALPLLTLLFGDDGPALADEATRARLQEQIAARRSTPAVLLQRWVRARDRDTKLSLALNKAAPPEVFAALAKDKNEEIRRHVADNPATPAAVLATLAGDRSDDVKLTLAENPNTPAETLESLFKEKIPKIKRHVARHKNTPAKLIETLVAHKDALLRCAVAGNPNLPYALLEQLRQDKLLELSQAVATHPDVPLPVLEGLARSRDKDVRAAVALNPNLPTALYCELATDPAPAVLRALVENPRTPPAVLQTLASSSLDRVQDALVDHPATPAAALAILAGSQSVGVRLGVLAHDNVLDDIVARLAEDDDAQVRATAALKLDPRRPSWLPVEISWEQYGDKEFVVPRV